MFGIINYIKESYDDILSPLPPALRGEEDEDEDEDEENEETTRRMSSYHFSGVSAGSWIAVILSMNYTYFKTYPEKYRLFQDSIIDIFETSELKSLSRNLKEYMLQHYDVPAETPSGTSFTFFSPASIQKIRIDVTEFTPFSYPFLKWQQISNFSNLEEVLDACIGSSHLSLLTNERVLYKYKNRFVFDGALVNFFRPSSFAPHPWWLNIHYKMWEKEKKKKKYGFVDLILELSNLRKRNKNFREMYELGYNDTRSNRAFLDALFLPPPSGGWWQEKRK